jgi:hypothetical protein
LIPKGSYGFLWIPMDSQGFLWIPKDSYGFLFFLWAVTEAITFEQLMKSSPRTVPRDTQEKLFMEYKRFNVLFTRSGGIMHAKNHLMLHLFQEVSHFGNARFYHTYLDESFNGTLAKIARSCHRLNWSEVVFNKISTATQLQQERLRAIVESTT